MPAASGEVDLSRLTIERREVEYRTDLMASVAAAWMAVVHDHDRATIIGFVQTQQAPTRKEPTARSAQDPHRSD